MSSLAINLNIKMQTPRISRRTLPAGVTRRPVASLHTHRVPSSYVFIGLPPSGVPPIKAKNGLIKIQTLSKAVPRTRVYTMLARGRTWYLYVLVYLVGYKPTAACAVFFLLMGGLIRQGP